MRCSSYSILFCHGQDSTWLEFYKSLASMVYTKDNIQKFKTTCIFCFTVYWAYTTIFNDKNVQFNAWKEHYFRYYGNLLWANYLMDEKIELSKCKFWVLLSLEINIIKLFLAKFFNNWTWANTTLIKSERFSLCLAWKCYL